jgi:hypothetical protein
METEVTPVTYVPSKAVHTLVSLYVSRDWMNHDDRARERTTGVSVALVHLSSVGRSH